jgi:hypothetical protein
MRSRTMSLVGRWVSTGVAAPTPNIYRSKSPQIFFMIQIILAQPLAKPAPSAIGTPARSVSRLTKVVVNAAIASISLGFSWLPVALAQPTAAPDTPEICEVNFNLLKADKRNDPNIVTADTVSAKGMTLPSLWWTSEQSPPKLVTNWIANRRQQQVYLLVNAQYWDLLDYIGRYQTIDRFGRVAQGYGYNLKICSSQKIVLARYNCNPLEPASCQVWLNATGQSGLGVQGK